MPSWISYQKKKNVIPCAAVGEYPALWPQGNLEGWSRKYCAKANDSCTMRPGLGALTGSPETQVSLKLPQEMTTVNSHVLNKPHIRLEAWDSNLTAITQKSMTAALSDSRLWSILNMHSSNGNGCTPQVHCWRSATSLRKLSNTCCPYSHITAPLITRVKQSGSLFLPTRGS